MSICNNCTHDNSCVFRMSEKYSSFMFCDGHEVQENLTSLSVEQTRSPQMARTILDLCADCDSSNTCTLRDPEHFIFQCEHYS
ncbi:hypothetical protein [Crocinitomix algicola]|uniref:hypothetical protein n=1 Tax=Crocinitomix algicola TaxID=1740263 RepID=UPI001112DDE5|nr:hypothetical protein [Crocinitomix algicola]